VHLYRSGPPDSLELINPVVKQSTGLKKCLPESENYTYQFEL